MPKKRKTYNKELKLKAVKLVVEENQSVTDVARTLEVPVGSLNRWIRSWRDQQDDAFPGNGKQALSPDQQEIKELKAKIKLLEMDKEILKKLPTERAPSL